MKILIADIFPKRLFFVFLIFFCSSCSSYGSSTPQDKVCFKGHCIDIEVAKSEEDLMRGLQSRNSLEKNHGMLFIFPRPGQYGFWMKDTLIPLDMIWLDEGQNVIYIARDVPACQSDPCPTYGPPDASRYVLEINAGEAKMHNIQIGDQAQLMLAK